MRCDESAVSPPRGGSKRLFKPFLGSEENGRKFWAVGASTSIGRALVLYLPEKAASAGRLFHWSSGTLAARKGGSLGMLNRRYAVLGWGVWKIGKKVAKRKAKAAVPGTGEHAGLNKSALAGIAAALSGALFFWRKKSSGSGE